MGCRFSAIKLPLHAPICVIATRPQGISDSLVPPAQLVPFNLFGCREHHSSAKADLKTAPTLSLWFQPTKWGPCQFFPLKTAHRCHQTYAFLGKSYFSFPSKISPEWSLHPYFDQHSVHVIYVFSKKMETFSPAPLCFFELPPKLPLASAFLSIVPSLQSWVFLVWTSKLFQPLPSTQFQRYFLVYRYLSQ